MKARVATGPFEMLCKTKETCGCQRETGKVDKANHPMGSSALAHFINRCARYACRSLCMPGSTHRRRCRGCRLESCTRRIERRPHEANPRTNRSARCCRYKCSRHLSDAELLGPSCH